MDGLPPPPPVETRPAEPPAGQPALAQDPYIHAATDVRPRTPREEELCDEAGTPDWLYLGVTVAANVGAGFADAALKHDEHMGIRLLGPGLTGLTFGFAVGGGYLNLPQCRRDWLHPGAPEGDVHVRWPIALSLALLSGAIAPILQEVESGGDLPLWGTPERSGRVLMTGFTAFGGALLPYLLPPRTWRAARELDKLTLRYDTGSRASFVGYTVRF